MLTANAYLGGWGIAAALERGADVVICPRVTDAALVVGPAAWRFGWKRDDWDASPAAVVAGHIIECGAQCTGGNYAFFHEVPRPRAPASRSPRCAADGSFVITKHPGTGGLVSVGTVTAQLLYEIGGPRYSQPRRHRALRHDRARAGGARSRARARRARRAAAADHEGVHQPRRRLPQLHDVRARRASTSRPRRGSPRRRCGRCVGGREQFAETRVTLRRGDRADPRSNEEAFAYLTVAVKDPDPQKVGRAFAASVVEMALASYPGFTRRRPPGESRSSASTGRRWCVGSRCRTRRARRGDDRRSRRSSAPAASQRRRAAVAPRCRAAPAGRRATVPLGTLCGARSGDKGGNANVGVWVRTPAAYAWLDALPHRRALRALSPKRAISRSSATSCRICWR